MQLVEVNGEYKLFLPEHRAARPEWYTPEGWEKERINALVESTSHTDCMFYIGAEEADIPAIISKYTSCDMVLFEPNDRVWPCIKAIWQANELKAPLDFFRGFASDKSTITGYKPNRDFFDIDVNNMISDHGFKQLYENYPDVPQVTIDDYCAATGFIPTIIAADIEGSEFKMLQGAAKTIMQHKPSIMLSVHQIFMWEHYQHEKCTMLKFLQDMGYAWRCIDYAFHEDHVFFYPTQYND